MSGHPLAGQPRSRSFPSAGWKAALIALAAALGACRGSSEHQAAPSATSSASARPVDGGALDHDPRDVKMFLVLPARFDSEDNPITEEKVKLGRMLFYEARLSRNHDISCNSCHDLASYGVDHQPVATGHKGQRGRRNALSVYNTGRHIAQFWDGRVRTLEEQAKGPILNPIEMAMPNEERVMDTLRSIPEYVALFKAAFPGDLDPVTFDNLAKAIGAFERQLVTPARFDRYLAGDEKALTEEEASGFHTFLRLGCPSCHNRAAVGGKNIQKLGWVNPYPDLTDNGRFDVTHDPGDIHYFRVPSLRNVEKTAPYFHDGSLATLDQVVRKMAWHQLGVQVTEEEVKLLVAFLKSLTGQIPTDYIQRPALPPSGSKTPRPDPT
jgi:cytochrome c peroxidase